MKVCLIAVEIFAWGKFGGFGRSTRLLGRELSRRGLEVTAVVPRRGDQESLETLDGMTIHGYPMRWPFAMSGIFERIDADVYHSQHPSIGTVLARRARPRATHIVTFRDPKEWSDWWVEFSNPSASRARVVLSWLSEDSPLTRSAVRRLDHHFVAAECLNPRIQRIYGFEESLRALPTPIRVPDEVAKSPRPLVTFVGRLDRRKRPERFLRLASRFPDVSFVIVGAGQDREFERALRRDFAHLSNVDFYGFVDQFLSDELSDLLGRTWILVNTSVREGLPTSILEALAHRCAILSYVNPDRIAERFGYHAAGEDFSKGLAWLLEEDRWRDLGEDGHRYVRDSFDLDRSVDRHVEIYRQLQTARAGNPTGNF